MYDISNRLADDPPEQIHLVVVMGEFIKTYIFAQVGYFAFLLLLLIIYKSRCLTQKLEEQRKREAKSSMIRITRPESNSLYRTGRSLASRPQSVVYT